MPSAGELLRDLAQIGRIFQRLATQMHAGRGQRCFGAAQVLGVVFRHWKVPESRILAAKVVATM